MKHVCVDARLYYASGIGTYLRTAIPALADFPSFRLTLLAREQECETLSRYGEVIPMKSWIYTLQEQFEYPRKIPRCDLFWSPHFNVPLFSIKAKKRLVTLCDVFHLAFFSSLTLLQKAYAKFFYAKACRLSNHITTLSEFSKQEIERYLPQARGKITVLSSPFFFRGQSVSSQKRESLLFVGNIKPHKNLVRLVEAYRLVQPDFPLNIVGKNEGLITQDTSLFQKVEKESYLKKNVRFLGVVSEQKLVELYSSAKLFVFPSLYEGYGYPPLEAMACGSAVAASDRASIPEVCKDAAIYFDPLSIEAIAKSIERLLGDQNLRDELVQKGFAHIKALKAKQNQIVEMIDACCCRT